jgi:hypothetical protein
MANVRKTIDAATGLPAPPLQQIVVQSATCLVCVSTVVTNDEKCVVEIGRVQVIISSLNLLLDTQYDAKVRLFRTASLAAERRKVRSCEKIPAEAIGAPPFISDLLRDLGNGAGLRLPSRRPVAISPDRSRPDLIVLRLPHAFSLNRRTVITAKS